MNKRQLKKRDRKIGAAMRAEFGVHRWRDLKHKATPEQLEAERAQIQSELESIYRCGCGE